MHPNWQVTIPFVGKFPIQTFLHGKKSAFANILEAQRLYAELLFFMFYILYIYIFLVIFLQKFNFYGFYIAVAPRLNSI